MLRRGIFTLFCYDPVETANIEQCVLGEMSRKFCSFLLYSAECDTPI